MPKNVVVCCDGTANEFAADRTNVIKLYSTLVQNPVTQVAYYHPGIGTMEPFGSLSPMARRLSRLLGMAIGYGLENDIRDAYVYLMRTYEPGDCVYLFGFSRGAYTVRAVAALIKLYGMLRAGNEAQVPYAIRMMMAIREVGADSGARNQYFALAAQFKKIMSCEQQPRMRFVGIWDTVSSVGWIENPLHLPYEVNNPDIEIGRHAVSIDEHRAFFRTHLWRPDPAKPTGPKDCQEVWFAGVHCDVGGGYPEEESGIAKYPLDWMLQEAKWAGLLVDAGRELDVLGKSGRGRYVAAALKEGHQSLKGAWHVAEFVPKRRWNKDTSTWERRMNLYHRRTLPDGALVHESVYQQSDSYIKKRVPGDATRVATRKVDATEGR